MAHQGLKKMIKNKNLGKEKLSEKFAAITEKRPKVLEKLNKIKAAYVEMLEEVKTMSLEGI